MTCAAAVLERPPRRLTRPKAADREAALLAAGRGACPVLCVDALLPYQRLPLNFDDGTLAELLDDVGEGGLVMATSWDPRRRRVRRQGTLARVEGEALRGVARCAVAGGDARVGRWRRYGATVAPGTAGAALRWGRERLTDATRTRRATPIARGFVVDCVGVDAAAEPPAPDEASPLEWSATRIDVAPPDAGDPACVERAAALAARNTGANLETELDGIRFYGVPIMPYSRRNAGAGSGCGYILDESEKTETNKVMIFVTMDQRNLFLGKMRINKDPDGDKLKLQEICVDHDDMTPLKELVDDTPDDKCGSDGECLTAEGLENCSICYVGGALVAAAVGKSQNRND